MTQTAATTEAVTPKCFCCGREHYSARTRLVYNGRPHGPTVCDQCHAKAASLTSEADDAAYKERPKMTRKPPRKSVRAWLVTFKDWEGNPREKGPYFSTWKANRIAKEVERQYDTEATVKETEVKAGDGCTERLWSDSHAGTILGFSASGKTVYFQRDKATLLNGPNSGEPDALECSTGGFCGHVEGRQRWAYERDPEARVQKATLRKNDLYKVPGTTVDQRGGEVDLGGRYEHYDFNF